MLGVLLVGCSPQMSEGSEACEPSREVVASAGSLVSRLDDVSAAGGRAWAVGRTETPVTSSAISRVWDGRRWSEVSTPQGPAARRGGAHLSGVDALTARQAWAVGGDATGRPLVLRWARGAWRVEPVPGVRGTLSDVAMTAPGRGWAVGTAANGDALVLRRTGRGWSPVRAAAAAAREATLTGVAALGRGRVWVVGRRDAGGSTAPVVLHREGGLWRRAQLPALPGALEGVAAAGRSNVFSVGWTGTWGDREALLLHWDGRGWSRMPGPTEADGSASVLAAVAIGPGGDAWSVGYTELREGGEGASVALRRDAAGWSPAVPAEEGRALLGVDVSGGSVWAVGAEGRWQDAYGSSAPLTRRLCR